eukprot:88597_1
MVSLRSGIGLYHGLVKSSVGLQGRLSSFTAAVAASSAKVLRVSILPHVCAEKKEISVCLPLSSRVGLTSITVPLSEILTSLSDTIKKAESEVSSIDIINGSGQHLDATSPVSAIIGGNVIVNETGCVHVAGNAFSGGGCGGNWGGREYTTSPSHEGHVGEEEVERCEDQETAAFRQAGLDGELQGTIPRREIEAFCAEKLEKGGEGVEVDRLVLARCTDRLEAEGLLTRSEDGEVLFMNPRWETSRARLLTALEIDKSAAVSTRKALKAQCEELELKNQQLNSQLYDAMAQSKKYAQIKSTCIFGCMVAQFSTLWYLTFEVYAWDQMEPAAYFLMLSYTVAASIYFGFKKRDATYQNLLEASLQKANFRNFSRMGYSHTDHQQVKMDLKDRMEAYELLGKRFNSRSL